MLVEKTGPPAVSVLEDLHALGALCGFAALLAAWGYPLWGEAWGVLCPLRELTGNDFHILPIEPRHTAVLIDLAFHHRDPFDRLLVAQAISEQIPLVSGDPALDAYPVTRLW